jgi:hypothetical protein
MEQKTAMHFKIIAADMGDADVLNREIYRMHKVIETLIVQGKFLAEPNLGQYVKERFTPKLQVEAVTDLSVTVPTQKKKPDFFTEVDDYIKSKEKKVCKEGLANFRNMKAHLLAYQEFTKRKITFPMIDS